MRPLFVMKKKYDKIVFVHDDTNNLRKCDNIRMCFPDIRNRKGLDKCSYKTLDNVKSKN